MTTPRIEFRKLTLDDIGRVPPVFDTEANGYPRLALVDMYGFLFPDGADEKPIWFVRHCGPDNVRFGAFHRPGDGFLSVQEPLHLADIAQRDAQVDGYRRVDVNAYGISAHEPWFDYRFALDAVTCREADILDLQADPFPYAILKHADPTTSVSTITQSCLLAGTYEGNPITGIGNFELVYVPQDERRELNDFFSYVYANDVGVRTDGRKEIARIYFSLDGHSSGFYWLEGEDPVISDDVQMDAEWVRLPYVDDDTCIYRDATWRFGGKEIHFTGLWGAKGLTAYPRLEVQGQSQVLGHWYEGSVPYEHSVSMTFHENMDVFAPKLAAGGFTVADEADHVAIP